MSTGESAKSDAMCRVYSEHNLKLPKVNHNSALPRTPDRCYMILDVPLKWVGFFHLKFPTYGSVSNLYSGRWVAFSKFL